MEKSVREVKAENSEFKAQQLMNEFQGQGGGKLPSFPGLGAQVASADNEEINKLRKLISQKTNEILQLNEDKQELKEEIENLQ